ncbi:LANO_0H04148g1_1 [Lachancea nothofagi CBS 11611]|uniref:LANO_0H04148g1_1 n=1 Tax=Lachancea nothofagi CBS 11611 TaxID=1266666 RepID=A0A1G4KLJ0_9SACH|nr:LANO_0H04148g1_1 [Lachancea nothofagi CBS 11611]
MAPRQKKNGSKKPVLETEEDFYDDATEKEEQAERWALSDVKKTIRQYALAFNSYEQGLNAPSSTVGGSYHIYYNQTRLLLKMYSDYIANDGSVNILQYVDLTDMGNLDMLFKPLPIITERFELAIAKFRDACSWDIYFNLLTCYFSQLEDYSELSGDQILELYERFKSTARRVIQLHLEELESWEAPSDTATPAPLDAVPTVDGNSGHSASEDNELEVMEMQDEITAKTLLDTLVVCYRCIATLIELLVESRNGTFAAINDVQANYLEDDTQQFKLQLDAVVREEAGLNLGSLETDELQLAVWSIDGLIVVSSTGFEGLKTFIAGIADSGRDTCVDKLLIAVDLLHLVRQHPKNNLKHNQARLWAVCTEAGRLLSTVEAKLAQKRQDTISGILKENDNELSPVVFKLCEVMISRSDNELYRHLIKATEASHGDPAAAKTAGILLRNAQVLLKNASTIAQQPCGFREYISDKLKRNYIYKQATERLGFMENGATTSTILELAQEHPFYNAQNPVRQL